MLEAFQQQIATSFPELRSCSMLIACSGGIDSVVLVHLSESCRLNYAIAHCNFGLRGAESDADEKFVASLAESLDRPYYTRRFDTLGYVNEKNLSVQMAARELRYHWFADILRKHRIDLLLTAHQADDELETFMINLSRGTGLQGLSGIPAKREQLIRPLLPFTRDQIHEYALAHQLEWREDSSNKDRKYLRNKIRHEIVPHLKELHPAFFDNFLRTLENLAGSVRLLQDYKNILRKEWLTTEKGIIKIPVAPMQELKMPGDYLYLLLSDYGFGETGELLSLLSASSGKVVYSKTHRLIRDREYLLLQELQEKFTGSYKIETAAAKVQVPIVLDIQEVREITDRSPEILYVDKETLNPVLELRKWHKGDYFYPLGMKGRKKVSKYFKDEKLDMIEKERQWLLCSGNDVVWIVGRRADERFKVTDTTNTILKITLEV